MEFQQFETAVSFRKTVHAYLKRSGDFWELTVYPYGPGVPYSRTDSLELLDVQDVLSWAKKQGYSEKFRSRLKKHIEELLRNAKDDKSILTD
ncbi:hypothetical protein A2962_05450 [Candidatus Woesebacteria bacterium RIFCSPLOWO2_01_FULL_39_61]|uniref:Uncharacterized protein n=1 Tax=Candidatus Woesebacteria bacterium RIFCSPHIGHO2_02_FULL_39_13 TaxID=1802505 RepID=A0A1F7Z4P0_9BACT|nr:MAG: hypothetical protein A2692_00765 [Candidatus Woesebacteria bacterium RIFCSPHIGHO2_01_FULL_39_95]OGM34653.1 MAG: hypothetical protein A3D01_06455 [Candidatus Woesebacteria bacterium RIFCSPHIGHO2_02_FULL_39_13]OGM37395.1 MAG: hypothetical protein A3E13_05485 [Candidatus Woesebacteria bacterium RIFCSPHIGHO2_12_FULL_40_20]OGM68361.1 MAG: hypothetical protein A2962_05450 [Candidatus Woesebacteria bacterium RIFCSPLOWO2_01_FULL_39_61]OGM71893.1 MAG: hypothetical protein A3H19_05450 [Candidatus